jgi:chondroitin AC lyase
VRHDLLRIAQVLFYDAGTVTIRSGLTLTVDQPCMVIVDESVAGPPVVTVSAPQTAGLAVTVNLNAGGTSTTATVTLPKGDYQGRSVTLGAPATDVAARRPTLASSQLDSAHAPYFLTDGNPNTRWSSSYADAQWVHVDLQRSQMINAVTLRWEAAYAKAFSIEVSADAVTWNTVYSTATGAGGTLTVQFKPRAARFVRLNLTQRGTSWGYSLWSVEVTGAPNLALGRPTTASSTSATTFPASYATDGNLGTRWSSAYTDPQWLQVDLGAPTALGSVVLRWEAASAKAYAIQTSNDAATWTTVYSTTTGPGGTETIPVSATGRYVRMYGTARNTNYGYSLWEFEVYGA